MTPYERLYIAEVQYLIRSGWDPVSDDEWDTPDDGRPPRTLRHGHAVNSQKHLDRMNDQSRAEADHRVATGQGEAIVEGRGEEG
jgi:hypothetical protein